MKKTDKSIVYYGPHSCKKCDPKGKKGILIAKAGNGSPDYMEYDYPPEALVDRMTNTWPPYPNTHPKLRWKRHKCTDITK